MNKALDEEIEYQAKRIYEKIQEYDYSEIEDEVLFAIIFTIKEKSKELSNLKKRLKKTVRDAYSCCDCDDHMKWDRLMDSLFKDMDSVFNEEIGKGLLEGDDDK